MLINAFETIREALSIIDVLGLYGVEVKRGNKALCPIHNENTPSFTIYHDSNSWHCFGCGAGGSVIDFVMTCFGLDALEAAKKLDADYNLGLFEHKSSQEEINLLSEQRAQNQAYKGLSATFDTYINKAYSLLCEYFHLLEDWKTTYAPKSLDKPEAENLLFIEACHKLGYVEHLLDSLSNASYDEQISFYQSHRKEMIQIAKRIKRHTEGANADKSA